jgi:hypothetical protein
MPELELMMTLHVEIAPLVLRVAWVSLYIRILHVQGSQI